MRNRLLALLLVVAMLIPTLAVAQSADELLAERYADPVTVHVVLGYRDPENAETPDSVTPETATAVKYFKELYNIDLVYDWIVNSDQFTAKFGAELVSGNLPDIMLLEPNQFEDLYSQGGLGDLTEAYAQYANEGIQGIADFDGTLLGAGMRDGKLYGLPMATYPGQVTSQIYYDMNQLKAAGIESYDQLPKTIAEFEALCDLLLTLDLDGNGKTGDPVLPANKYYIDAGLADFSPVFHAYGSWAEGWYDDGTGNLIYAGIQPSLVNALTKLNEWYNKGYFPKDFAAQDVWAADAPVVSDIVAGKYAIVMGSWWIPNWPLNDNKKNNPDAEWVVGPTLTVDGEVAPILVPRYSVNGFVAVSANFEHPEALFKMMNWSIDAARKYENMEWLATATEDERLEANSHVYTWLPYRVYFPDCLIENYLFCNAKAAEGSTTLAEGEALNNSEFWGTWTSYVKHMDGTEDATSWGRYLSRVDPQGGVGKMYDLYTNAEKLYREVYITTESMITRSGELNKYRDNTFLSMIMGETPISSFETYVSQWKALGGDLIMKEVNDWFANK